MKQNKTISNLLSFYITAEKLKTTLRHSWTSNKERQESTAEHSWMLNLIAMTLFEYIDREIDQLKVLKMVTLHDLAEAVTGDVPAFDKKGRIGKYEREKEALEMMFKHLSEQTAKEFMDLWEEYEAKETSEAKVGQAIDKMEAVIQHNISDISTWDQGDFDIHPFYKYEYFQFDQFFLSIRDTIEIASRKKITDAKQLSKLKTDMKKIYEELNAKDL